MQSPLEHVFIYNHCYIREVRVSILDIPSINSLLLDQPESCHGINLMSLASTGLHQLDARSPWKLSSTANFCSCFCFRKCIRSLSNSMISINLMHGLLGSYSCTTRFCLFLFSTTLFGTNLMRLPWQQLWFLMAIMFGEVSFMASSAYPFHDHFSNYTMTEQRVLPIMKGLVYGQLNRLLLCQS